MEFNYTSIEKSDGNVNEYRTIPVHSHSTGSKVRSQLDCDENGIPINFDKEFCGASIKEYKEGMFDPRKDLDWFARNDLEKIEIKKRELGNWITAYDLITDTTWMQKGYLVKIGKTAKAVYNRASWKEGSSLVRLYKEDSEGIWGIRTVGGLQKINIIKDITPKDFQKLSRKVL